MSTEAFTQLDELKQSQGPAATIDKLIENLREQKNYHKLFDAQLLKTKFDMGLPLARPTSFDDVPDDKRDEFEQHYIDAARTVGESFLANGDISQAWVYYRTIREPEPVKQAIDEMSARLEPDEQTEEIINIALYEGANPVKGLEIMLKTHGTCNTITALDQQLPQLDPADRHKSAALLVRELYGDLTQTLRHEVEQRLALAPPVDSIRELIAGREWLFEEGNYHIDVSHLNSVVRFARSLDSASPEIKQAIELCEYGTRLESQFQYPGDPPFEDFYPAHRHFFRALAGDGADDALAYFREKLDQAPDEPDKQLIAYVLVDLLVRSERMDDAIDLAEQHLTEVEEASGFSFANLCQQAGRLDTLQKVAKKKGDLVGYAAAILQDATQAVSE